MRLKTVRYKGYEIDFEQFRQGVLATVNGYRVEFLKKTKVLSEKEAKRWIDLVIIENSSTPTKWKLMKKFDKKYRD